MISLCSEYAPKRVWGRHPDAMGGVWDWGFAPKASLGAPPLEGRCYGLYDWINRLQFIPGGNPPAISGVWDWGFAPKASLGAPPIVSVM